MSESPGYCGIVAYKGAISLHNTYMGPSHSVTGMSTVFTHATTKDILRDTAVRNKIAGVTIDYQINLKIAFHALTPILHRQS